MKTKTKKFLIGLVAVAFLIVFDQFTKVLAVKYLQGNDGITLIKGVFKLHYLENVGAAFGIFKGMQLPLIIFTSIVIIVILYLWYNLPETKRFNAIRVLAVFITAGAIGNLIDRIAHNYVIDFFYFELINFPIFNVADCYITCAEILLILLLIFYYKEDELNMMLPKLKKDKKAGEQ